MVLQIVRIRGLHRQQLCHHRLLRHGVDELRVDDEQPVDAAVLVGVEHDLHRAEQVLQMRLVAETGGAREDRQAETAEERQPLAAEHAETDLRVFTLPVTHQTQRALEDVGVERAAETAIARHDDDPDVLRLTLDEERMLVVGVRFVEVSDHGADLVGVRTGQAHPLLGAAHLARRDHLHRLGDLLSALHTRDLGADLFGAWHLFSPVAWLSRCRWPRSPRRSPSASPRAS